jgi:hypothetical protein
VTEISIKCGKNVMFDHTFVIGVFLLSIVNTNFDKYTNCDQKFVISKMSQLEKEEVTQAVIIADNFNRKFCPMTDNFPLVSFRDFLSDEIE